MKESANRLCFLHVKERFYDKRDHFNASTKAKNDIVDFLSDWGVPFFLLKKNSTKVHIVNVCIDFFRFLGLLLQMYISLSPGTILLVQRRFSYPKLWCIKQVLKKRKSYLCVLVHDLNLIRFGLRKREMKTLSLSDSLIVHSQAMKRFLEEKGVSCFMVTLNFFDYRIAKGRQEPRKCSNAVVFAGNLDKSAFLPDLVNERMKAVTFNLYGYRAPKMNEAENICYKGSFSPSDVSAIEGAWGLVWDGTSIASCEGVLGEYLRYNSPHKMSLYIVSRLPLIVWSHSSVADFVKKEQLGIAIDSLYELEQRLSEITEDEYMRMQKNVQALSEKLSSGQMLRCALSEVVSYTKNLV